MTVKRIQERKRKQNAKGFTLLETLITAGLIALVSALVALGIPTVQNAYEKTVLAANADALLHTAAAALRDDLGTARKVKTADGGKTLLFYNENLNTDARLFLADGVHDKEALTGSVYPAGQILYQRYTDQESSGLVEGKIMELLSAKPYSAGLYVTYSRVTCADGIVTFHDLEVKWKRAESERSLAARKEVSVRTAGG